MNPRALAPRRARSATNQYGTLTPAQADPPVDPSADSGGVPGQPWGLQRPRAARKSAACGRSAAVWAEKLLYMRHFHVAETVDQCNSFTNTMPLVAVPYVL